MWKIPTTIKETIAEDLPRPTDDGASWPSGGLMPFLWCHLVQQRGQTMGLKRTDALRTHATRVALSSGLTRKQVADDLAAGMSSLNKWITAHRDTDMVSALG
jgi:transposase